MAETETFQISLDAAEVYESKFVPAIFAEWADRLVEAVDVAPMQAVLDVACGTGIVARTVADRIGSGTIVGLDLNAAMLAVAHRLRPDLEWHQGDAVELPFPERTFDRVLCQMGLMFVPDRARAIREMARVATGGSTVGIVVPASIGEQPAYRELASIVADEAGAAAAVLIDTYWSCGDLDELRALFSSAGLTHVVARTHLGTARFRSADELVATEVEGSPLITQIDDATYTRIRERARTALEPFATQSGSLHAPLRGHIVTGTVP
ncbi:methyltransferase domain-containing protein [Phytoactinopolyspora sp. XMNu-373]|uniref:Methyltransferase domain-containing protein n=2 Tax=Phytoactinopolyspora mesophila TaxID=2650750 RepID=A0A7K3MB61_9ACTN|nr:methyltransferase domain-containing protein [Phytoactinopolyspora mesophila]